MAGMVAHSDASVLISGESGTGKEVMADYIHRSSCRGARPFIKINCGALPGDLVETELFGHRKGSFTGATRDHQGVMEAADGGSLLLDEVGEMPPTLQTKLLRVLQEREFRPVGSTKSLATNFRLICTTNVDVEEALGTGALRSDLYYRISTVALSLPPLRERREDILTLAHYFRRRHCREHRCEVEGFTPDAERALLAYDWPGNARELGNVIERAVIIARRRSVDACDLPRTILSGPTERAGRHEHLVIPDGMTLAEVERATLLQALERHRFNKQATARALGLHRATLYSKLHRHHIASARRETKAPGAARPD
jgi:transcriptional regulator with PAS, ATPase and Fis domain